MKPKLVAGILLLAVGFFAIAWSGSMDCMSEQQRIDKVNAEFRPIHDKLDKGIEQATADQDTQSHQQTNPR